MNQFFRDREKELLILILLVAAAMRIGGLTAFSLSNDELSAMNRLQFDSIAEVIRNGVYPDYHPAGVQLFMYIWTKLFGDSEFIIRFPFALFGVGSVYFLYKTGRLWFGAATGLLAAAVLAVLEYPILYSQIARPYSPGLFFSLLAVWYWTRAVMKPEFKANGKVNLLNYLGFILSVSACMYIHYFSFIFAGILCFTGLFFLRRETFLPYLLSGAAIVLLYIPGSGVFIHQLGKGGVGGSEGWLGPPESDSFEKYLKYVFNDSGNLRLLFLIIGVGSYLVYRKNVKPGKYQLLCILFFLLPFFIAYYYSIWKNPVLQYSVLLFSFPFLLLLLFSFIPAGTPGKTVTFLIIIVLTGGAYSTIEEKKYYSSQHFSEFRGIADRIIELDSKYGKDSINHVINIHAPYYINYYLDKKDHKTNFSLYRVTSDEEIYEFSKIVEESRTPYFLFAFSNMFDTPEFDQIIRSRYRYLLLRDSMLYSGLRFYTLHKVENSINQLPLFTYQYGFENQLWEKESDFKDDSLIFEGMHSAHISSEDEYGPGFFTTTGKTGIQKGSKIELSAVFNSDNLPTNAKLVFSIEKNGKSLIWEGRDIDQYLKISSKWARVYMTVNIPFPLTGDEDLKIYCWNEKRKNVWMDDFRMDVF
jgi:hypothetical protein